jgi:hypothetical protein
MDEQPERLEGYYSVARTEPVWMAEIVNANGSPLTAEDRLDIRLTWAEIEDERHHGACV